MTPFLAEVLATATFIFVGCCVCANNMLDKTGGHGGGILMIASGWAIAVMLPAVMFGPISGSYLNPAIAIAHACIGLLTWKTALSYCVAEMLGAMLGAALAWLFYKPHFDASNDAEAKLNVFCTRPAIKNWPLNMFSELFGTFFLTFAALALSHTSVGDVPMLNTFASGALIYVIGVSIGGTTGYAINPARDLGPRIMHALLPIKNKRDSNWGYAWLPVVCPIVGAIVGAYFYQWVF